MPNWCQNNMTVTGSKEDVESFLQKTKSEEKNFDFNKILPMPKELDIDDCSVSEDAYKFYYGTQAMKPLNYIPSDEKKILADAYKNNKEIFGHTTWYGWCREKWGVKWNASDSKVGETVKMRSRDLYRVNIYFETAWDIPRGVYEEIAKQHPELKFSITIDEEGGWFYGKIVIKNGEVKEYLKKGIRAGGPFSDREETEDEIKN